MTARHAWSALHAVCDGVGMAEPHPTTEETWEGFYLREQHKDDGVPERGDEMTVRTDARTRRPSSGRWTGSGCTPGEPW